MLTSIPEHFHHSMSIDIERFIHYSLHITIYCNENDGNLPCTWPNTRDPTIKPGVDGIHRWQDQGAC